jgi:hypothetical protein
MIKNHLIKRYILLKKENLNIIMEFKLDICKTNRFSFREEKTRREN